MDKIRKLSWTVCFWEELVFLQGWATQGLAQWIRWYSPASPSLRWALQLPPPRLPWGLFHLRLSVSIVTPILYSPPHTFWYFCMLQLSFQPSVANYMWHKSWFKQLFLTYLLKEPIILLKCSFIFNWWTLLISFHELSRKNHTIPGTKKYKIFIYVADINGMC